ncbi:MAG: prenyltransferase [Chloroflexi bacterium]|nr:prenyltransferase [Chloroflexota bacterium]
MATARTAVRVLRLGRLHFVLAGLLLFSWGALLAVLAGAEAAWGRFALGYLVLFPAHLSVSYSNDYFDAEADAYGTPTLFTGGSGILQAEPALRPLARAIALGLIGLSLVMGIVFAWRYGGGVGFVGLVLVGNLLGWFYAAPPLRLSYRGLGEAATAAMVGFLLPALGFLVMAGALEGPFLLVAPALLLYGASFIVAVQIPDVEADRLAGKNTLVGRRGRPWAFSALGLLPSLATVYLLVAGWFLREVLALPLWPVGLLSVSVAVAGIVGAVRRPTQRTAATRLVNAFLIALVLFVLAADAYWLLAL